MKTNYMYMRAGVGIALLKNAVGERFDNVTLLSRTVKLLKGFFIKKN